MSRTSNKPAGKSVAFRVIEGGLCKPGNSRALVQAAQPVGQPPSRVEAGRLGRAIMQLPLPKVGLTLEQAIDEVCSMLWEVDLAKHQRSSYLCDAMEDLGIRFQMADPSLDLAREGFLVLVWPQRLLDQHPELAGLHPLAHQYMQLG
jgi:hypothetical protein